MALTETEKDWIRDHVVVVSAETSKAVITEVLKAHVNSCPHGKRLIRIVYIAIGVGVGSGFAGSGVAWGIIRLIASMGGG